MLRNTRKGSHAEYLANYYLSILGFSTPVPRQEDYGIDMMCSLTTEKDKQIFQGEPFSVQVKSSYSDISFGKKQNGWNFHQIKFLFNIKIPFFFAIVDFTDDSLNIYPTSLLWFIKKRYPNCSHLVFSLDSEAGESIHHAPEPGLKISKWNNRGGDGYRYKCDLQKPLLKITSSDLKLDEKRNLYKEILRAVIIMEQRNIIFDELSWPYFHWPHKYITNCKPIEYKSVHFCDEPEISDPEKIMEENGQMIVALALSFKLHKREEEYKFMTEITKRLPKKHHLPELYVTYKELFKQY